MRYVAIRARSAHGLTVAACLFLASIQSGFAAPIAVSAEDNLAALVAAAPPGAAFELLPGTHRFSGIQPKDGQSFDGRKHAVATGAVKISGFVRAGNYWRASGPAPLTPSHGPCDDKGLEGANICELRERLFVDDKPLRRSPTINEISKNGWYQDRTTGDIFVAADPGVSDVELSYDDFAFGGNARDVAIRGLIIEYYASFAQHGAIAGQDSSSWLLEQNNVRFNSGAGIRTGDSGMRIM